MYKKRHRLTKNKEFENVFKKGRSSFDNIIGIKIAKNSKNIVRFGIVVSTKISKKAVERNKIKRRIRSILNKKLNNIENGYDIVIITLPTIKEKSFEDLLKSITKHFIKLKITRLDEN